MATQNGGDSFSGFPAEGLAFLVDLRENNTKEWFEAQKSLYKEAVQAPAIALVAALGRRLAEEFPPVSYDTRTNGGSLMRIYRDTRFSKDKTPYKTNVAMMFAPPGQKKMAAAGFGLQITPEGIDLVAGQFAFDPEELERYRAAVVDEEAGAALEAAAAKVSAAAEVAAPGSRIAAAGRGVAGGGLPADTLYHFGDPELKRVPRGFDANHPRGRWLRRKGLPVFSPQLDRELALRPELVDEVMTHFRNMAPVWRWVMEYVNRG